jgi:hypothetical protein
MVWSDDYLIFSAQPPSFVGPVCQLFGEKTSREQHAPWKSAGTSSRPRLGGVVSFRTEFSVSLGAARDGPKLSIYYTPFTS